MTDPTKTPSAASLRSLDDIEDTGAAWLAESELARLVAIVKIVQKRRGRFAHESRLTDNRNDEEKALDALLETFA